MSLPTHSELSDFHRFLGEMVNNGGSARSPEEALDEWRSRHPDPDFKDQEIAAIQEAINAVENGELGMGFEEFDREFRARHQLPSES